MSKAPRQQVVIGNLLFMFSYFRKIQKPKFGGSIDVSPVMVPPRKTGGGGPFPKQNQHWRGVFSGFLQEELGHFPR